MKYTRRDFIKFGSLAAGILPTLASHGFARADSMSGALFLQNSDSFRGLIGSQFTFYRTDLASTAVLTEVQDYQAAGIKSGGNCFSLVFEMPSDDFVQETYDMFHPSIGKFELLSVPGKSEKGTSLLIAVINRL
jgi:hypothetical protein